MRVNKHQRTENQSVTAGIVEWSTDPRIPIKIDLLTIPKAPK